jgi:hypothetical protein
MAEQALTAVQAGDKTSVSVSGRIVPYKENAYTS